ncbi:hypothetical protein RI129_006808 [Pyrocoelia pectoralis]|uniref:AIMP2 thioredoxin-like domain-containing protein n=1 Tax=Pyrocoelia pectoralis TaxID=417401 RepID=A0AAN7VEV4_9COLE
MNGPVNFYKTREIIRHDVQVLLPNNMYKMKNIHGNDKDEGHLGDHVSPFEDTFNISMQGMEDRPEINMLESRLRKIVQELNEIREDMVKLKGAVSLSEVVNDLHVEVTTVPNLNDTIVNASPSHPPYSLLSVQKLCSRTMNLLVSTHLHSTISALTDEAETFGRQLSEFRPQPNLPNISLRLIWKNIGPSPELIVGHLPISGEPNMLRYFARVLPTIFTYENSDNVIDLDSVLDISYCLVRSRTKTERTSYLQSLSKKLGKSPYFGGHTEITIADIAACSAIKQVAQNEINQSMSRWLVRCE